ncbi:ECF RNA polymerase sigma factor SigE [Botrimarina colliarenosi]|uniref:ECF RNA polymerase sigma factor SigE n=1 Tax=Botrimarina colliarenosi TaxID=2528001 RepID=A0A5C6A3P2_9BACT|nr:sigma-70 family RNA polymerase sigma factor [Botrimarina colliarenosi]TWT94010.1 ECF RNA polymerase sigma factor SigE [Botrimarina colliarenosi]
MSSSQLPSDKFVGFLTASQDRLRAYVLACVGNYSDAGDILQKTNVVLLRKAREFQESVEFEAWAIGVAKFEVLAFVRDRQRERLSFSSELVELMVDASEEAVGTLAKRQIALRSCLASLPEEKQLLIRMRYAEDLSMGQIASHLGKSVGSVKALVRRVRALLHECVATKLAQSSPSAS